MATSGEDRQAPSSWPPVSKAMKVAPLSSAASTAAVPAEVLEAENRLPLRGSGTPFLELLDLDDKLTVPRIALALLLLQEILRRKTRRQGPFRLHDDLVTCPNQFADARGRQRDANSPSLISSAADTHSETSSGPR